MIRLSIFGWFFKSLMPRYHCSKHLKAKDSAQVADNEMKSPRVRQCSLAQVRMREKPMVLSVLSMTRKWGHVENGVDVKNEENNGEICLSRTKYVY